MENNAKLLVAAGFDEALASELAEKRIGATAARSVMDEAATIQAVIETFEIEDDFAHMDKAIVDREKELEHESLLEGIWQSYEDCYQELIDYDQALKETPGPYKDLWDLLDATNDRLNDRSLKTHMVAGLREQAADLHTKIQQIRNAVTQERKELCALALYDAESTGAEVHMRKNHPKRVKALNNGRTRSWKPELFVQELDEVQESETK